MRPIPSTPARIKAETRWNTSSYSGHANNCLEHGVLNGAKQAVRDTKDPVRRTTLTFPAGSWQAFLEAIARETL
ncbi:MULTISPECIES: DUF397 domain-containing protein [Streptomyces]|uniref:DUF397 domain-containing protein n=1 Tax=Streptomyces TaxID=1883 RepID=UPI00163D2C7D|nr:MULTISPECIES: DUF397 domain-containing protein [Streptomyces]MBC2873920.1 DUF397 domain-containing protein [Streptomyces sp. TYQ1024]UBI39136.1 DUF397 domain-containing protein [Streptomyces mobaraensis]UKW31716.1 DUF397 domain-containing protein [Streptomyces sp. TYQ1024]